MKKYIAEGRSIVREIEADTFEENPPLFREYMNASSDIKPIMDNQFKNVKTHARLLSKAMWYEWRMKLLDGLKEGLVGIREGMKEDENRLFQQENFLELSLPTLIEENDHLQAGYQTLQAQADEVADCDQDELRDAREKLTILTENIEERRMMVDKLRNELQSTKESIEYANDRKDEYLAEIQEAENVRQESHPWKMSDITELQGKGLPTLLT